MKGLPFEHQVSLKVSFHCLARHMHGFSQVWCLARRPAQTNFLLKKLNWIESFLSCNLGILYWTVTRNTGRLFFLKTNFFLHVHHLLTSQNGKSEVLSLQTQHSQHWDGFLQWWSSCLPRVARLREGPGWNTATVKEHQGQRDKNIWIHEYLKHHFIEQHVPQKWRPWLTLLCSRDDCSP